MAEQSYQQETHVNENGHRPPGITWTKILRVLMKGENPTFFVDAFCLALAEEPEAVQELYEPDIKQHCAMIRRQYEPLYRGKLFRFVRATLGRDVETWDADLALLSLQQPSSLPKPESGTTILTTTYPPPRFFVKGMLHEGLTLLAGKMKRGKSYLALHLAMDISFGRLAFQHLPTLKSRVLYISLEDHQPLIQKRLWDIQPNLTALPDVEFVYEFPPLGNGALEALQRYAAEGAYQVIIIDTIGRITPDFGLQRRQMNEYAAITHVLGPLQKWANDTHVAVVMIDHVRKAEADDIFDTVMGSSGKMAIVDHGIVYQRKDYELDALLHMRGRWMGDDKMVLTLADGHLEFLGQGEQYDLSREQKQVLRALEEEEFPVKIQEIMATLGTPQGQYGRFKKLLQRMVREGLIDRTGHGAYCALKRADYDDADVTVTEERERYP